MSAVPGVVTVEGVRHVSGSVHTPGDKSVSHRSLILGALAEGRSHIEGLSDGADVAHTLRALRSLGAAITVAEGGPVVIDGGRSLLRAGTSDLDCGNSGTSMRLLAGLVASIPGRHRLVGDDSLSVRPMDRIAGPLGAMGATLRGRGATLCPPLEIEGGALQGIEWTLPVASAQVKSAILLAGLGASGETVVHEPEPTRPHTEEMLAEAGAAIEVRPEGGGRVIRLRPGALRPVDRLVPGDPSQAAFWIVAAVLAEHGDVTVEDVYIGEQRTGYIGVLARMGADVALEAGSGGSGRLRARSSALHATIVEAREIPSLDEVPVLAVAAALAEGTTIFRDAGELRVKESDRMRATVELVEAFGGRAEELGDDLAVHGLGPRGHLHHAAFATAGDHRMAMAAAVAALVAGPGQSTIEGFSTVATSYPGFLADLARLTAHRPAPLAAERAVVAIDGPAGAGKSTVAGAVAERLGVERLDTGAMYRAVAATALSRGIDPADHDAVVAIAEGATIGVGPHVLVDGDDVTALLRTPDVGRAVSVVAANPDVRRHLVERQRRWVRERGGGVVEGRDIGTVVFPEARLKVYLTASPEERARRRDDESAAGVARRDHIDSTRAASPLVVAEDARQLDTTGRSVEDVVEEVLSWL